MCCSIWRRTGYSTTGSKSARCCCPTPSLITIHLRRSTIRPSSTPATSWRWLFRRSAARSPHSRPALDLVKGGGKGARAAATGDVESRRDEDEGPHAELVRVGERRREGRRGGL